MTKGTTKNSSQNVHHASQEDATTKKDSNPPQLTKNNGGKVWNQEKVLWLLAVSVISIVTRFYGINRSDESTVVEEQVITSVTNYLKREYFIDEHPPLGKLFFAAVNYLCGDGSSMNPTLNIIAMRVFAASCGSLIIIFAYALLVEMKFSLSTAIIGTSLIVFDSALLTISTSIMLDSQVICFTLMASFCWVKFRSFTNRPFSLPWSFWLIATGIYIGLVLGVKSIGLLIAFAIGVCAFLDLWDIMDPKKTKSDYIVTFHWIARIVFLIVLPVIIILGCDLVHLLIVKHSGSGDIYMSEMFQATLKGNNISDSARYIYYGDVIQISSHEKVNQSFLHSHYHKYPLIYDYETYKFSSGGQQVTGTNEPNENSNWMFLPATINPKVDYHKERIKHGDLIRLKHVSTGKYLATIGAASPLGEFNGSKLEVTAFEDESDHSNEKYRATVWSINDNKRKQLRGRFSAFELIQNTTYNTLSLNLIDNLPDWGFGMREVFSVKYGGYNPNSWWKVDSIQKSAINYDWTEDDFDEYYTFWDKFGEFCEGKFKKNISKIRVSSNFTAPSRWPLPSRETKLWISEDKNILLFQNPLSWSLSFLSIPLFVTLALIDFGAFLRETTFLRSEQKKVLYSKGLFFLLCYLIHYLTFFFMDKKYTFQHYLPAYIFSALIFATSYQIIAIRFKILSKPAVVAAICSLIAGSGIIAGI